MLSTFTRDDLAALDIRADGYTDATDGIEPTYPDNWAYMTGYNEGIRDRIEAAKRELDFAAFFSDADEF